MGINLFKRSSDVRWATGVPLPTDPDPRCFEVEEGRQFGKYCVLRVRYPNCTNYEGTKIILAKGLVEEFEEMEELDPHFLPNNKIIARFVPNAIGMHLALETAKSLQDM